MNYTKTGNAINITLNTPAKISGILIKLSSQEPVKVSNIGNIPFPECTTNTTVINSKQYPPFENPKKRLSSIFTCPSRNINIGEYPLINWILVTFSEKLTNCNQIQDQTNGEQRDCSANLEFVELYEVNQDDCNVPDFPAFGGIIFAKKTIKNKTQLVLKYSCDEHFYIDGYNDDELSCPRNGDWWPKYLPKCKPRVTCDVSKLEIEPGLASSSSSSSSSEAEDFKDKLNLEIKVKISHLWDNNKAVVGSIAKFECKDEFNLTKINGSMQRVCRSDGTWSDQNPECYLKRKMNKIQSSTTTTLKV